MKCLWKVFEETLVTVLPTLLPDCRLCLRREHQHVFVIPSFSAGLQLRRQSSQELRNKKKVYQEGWARWLSRRKYLCQGWCFTLILQDPLGRRQKLLPILVFWLLDTYHGPPAPPLCPHKIKNKYQTSFMQWKRNLGHKHCGLKNPLHLCFAMKCIEAGENNKDPHQVPQRLQSLLTGAALFSFMKLHLG